MKHLSAFFRSKWELKVIVIMVTILISAISTFNLLVIACVSSGTLLVFIILLIISVVIRARDRQIIGESEAFRVPRRGLIFTVGWQKFTIEYAIKAQNPDFFGFICSQETEIIVNELVDAYAIPTDRYKKKIVDIQDIKEIRLETGLILDWMHKEGLSISDVAVDITGGMTIMSVAVYTLAAERSIDSQYIKSKYDRNNKPIMDTQEAIFVARFMKEGLL